MKERIAEFLLECNHRDECKEPDLVRDVIKMWTDPAHTHPELGGLYFPGKGYSYGSGIVYPHISEFARRGNFRMLQIKMKEGAYIGTGLRGAVEYGHVPFLDWMLTTGGATFEVDNEWMWCPRLNEKMVNWLLNQNHNSTLVFDALRYGHLNLAKTLICKGEVLHIDRVRISDMRRCRNVDVLDWMKANGHLQINEEDLNDYIESKYEEEYLTVYPELLDWLADNGCSVEYDWVGRTVGAAYKQLYGRTVPEHYGGPFPEDPGQDEFIKVGLEIAYVENGALCIAQWLYEHGYATEEDHFYLETNPVWKQIVKCCKVN